MSAIRPGNKISTQQQVGCTEVISRSRHWPCLFPSTDRDAKHTRKIELAQWQLVIVKGFPVNSPGDCSILTAGGGVNRVRRRLADGDHRYEYPRYIFTNESRDILGLCGAVLDDLGVAWRFSRRNTISVARREAVARLDEFVGSKY
jgi:hypothetical protein